MHRDYLLSLRATERGRFVPRIGATRHLVVPRDEAPDPAHAIAPATWLRRVQQAATWRDSEGNPRGDLLFVVHGYAMSEAEVIDRHRRLQDALALQPQPFRGVVVSFDWPCGRHALAYLADRHRAKLSALRLVSDGIRALARRQRTGCALNIHVLGHSTGASVIREAFDDADDSHLPNGAWNVSQVCFIAADVSAASLDAGCVSSESLYRHCVRLTNYHSRLDDVLDLSNVKRLGLAPRAGRVGLGAHAPAQAVDVDCTPYYRALRSDPAMQARDEPGGFAGDRNHSWYFGNRRFAADLLATITGVDRWSNPARMASAPGELQLAAS
jgi:hypothetical protein